MQRPLVFIIIPIPPGLSRGRTTKASLCEGGGSAKRWRRERCHAFFLSPSRLRRQPPHRGGLAARQRCHSEPVTVSLAWESVLSFVGKRIAAPVCTPRALASRRRLARNDRLFRQPEREPSGFPFTFNQPPQRSSSEAERLRFFQLPALCCKKPDHRPSSSAR